MTTHETSTDPPFPGEEFSPEPTFAGLIASRKAWLDGWLKPWCRLASRKDLLLAEQEWIDIAGKVDPEKTLWSWAWSRFPALIHPELGIDESRPVRVVLGCGQVVIGYPDARRSRQGELWILSTDDEGTLKETGPLFIDAVAAIVVEAVIDSEEPSWN